MARNKVQLRSASLEISTPGSSLLGAVLSHLAREDAERASQLELAARRRASLELSAHPRRVRWAHVYYAPCSLCDIYVAAYAMEVQIVKEPDLAWLPEFLLSVPQAPPGFVEEAEPDAVTGRLPMPKWASVITGERTHVHPFELFIREARQAVGARQCELLDQEREYFAATSSLQQRRASIKSIQPRRRFDDQASEVAASPRGEAEDGASEAGIGAASSP
jgi:hypothetical protein